VPQDPARAKPLQQLQPSAWVRRFPVDGGLLLLDELSSRLFAYNDTARHVWDLIEFCGVQDECAVEFARAWEIPLSLARDDIAEIVAQWRTQGLLAGETETAPSARRSAAASAPARVPRGVSQWICTIRHTTISFAVESELSASIRAILAHLETPGATIQAHIEIRDNSNGETVLLSDGIERIRTHDLGALGGALWQAILECIHPGVEWLALLHAAAVTRNGVGIALSGPSGTGKTTLTAALTGAGYDYLADDLVAVSAPAGTIMSWPVPLSVKSGSFDVLTRYRPELAAAPHYRTKGMNARLLVPSPAARDAPAVQLRRLVFPRFSEGAAPDLRRISTFEAIGRLLADRAWMGHPLTAERVAAFLTWLTDTPAYAVAYGTLADGTRLIEAVT
jgi:hypothetical protein